MDRPLAMPIGKTDIEVGLGLDGSTTYSYNFNLPVARGRFQPELSLQYNSRNSRQRGYGVGWTLNLTYIERNVRTSPQDATGNPSEQYLLVSPKRSGILALWKESPSEKRYRTAVEHSYFELIRNSNSPARWDAYDGIGNHYIFENAFDSEGKACTTTCVRWYLSSVEDVDHNVSVYEYFLEGHVEPNLSSSAFLRSITYNFFNPSGGTNPIGHSGEIGTRVQLWYEQDLTPEGKIIPQVESIAGGLTKHIDRLALIKIATSRKGSHALDDFQEYSLVYQHSNETRRSLLSAIEIRATGGHSGPRPTRFLYNTRPDDGAAEFKGLEPAIVFTLPNEPSSLLPTQEECSEQTGNVSCTLAQVAAWIDIDGDGRPDLVWGQAQHIRWARNITPTGSRYIAFGQIAKMNSPQEYPGKLWFSNPSGEQIEKRRFPLPSVSLAKGRFQDLNGDGKGDLIYIVRNKLWVALGTGGGFRTPVELDIAGPAAEWAAAYPQIPFAMALLDYEGDTTVVDLVDLTGDGILDYVFGERNDHKWHVFPGYQRDVNQFGFSTNPKLFNSDAPYIQKKNGERWLVDMNGDGLLDMVTGLGGPEGKWAIYYNTGLQFKWGGSYGYYGGLEDAYVKFPDYQNFNLMGHGTTYGAQGILMDFNGDGLPDYAYRQKRDECAACPLIISWNHGRGFGRDDKSFIRMPISTPTTSWQLYPYMAPRRDSDGYEMDSVRGMLIDLNADAIPDYILIVDNTPRFFLGTSSRRDHSGRGMLANRSDLLTSIIGSLGTQSDLFYEMYSARVMSMPVEIPILYPLLKMVTTSGPGLQPRVVKHWYDKPIFSASRHIPLRFEFQGFQETWTGTQSPWTYQDDLGRLTHTIWATGDFAGLPAQILEELSVSAGTSVDPPQSKPLKVTSITYQSRSVAGGCGSNWFPLIPIATLTQTGVIENEGVLTSEELVRCEQIDVYGNVKHRTVNPDSTQNEDGYKDEYQVRIKFPSDFPNLQEALCKICPMEEEIFAIQNYPDNIGERISHKVFRYDAPPGEFDPPEHLTDVLGHLNFVKQWLKEEGRFVTKEKTSYQGNGLVSEILQKDPARSVRYQYDEFQLATARIETSGSTGIPTEPQRVLITDLERETRFGKIIAIKGPYLSDLPQDAPTTWYAYDHFGRLEYTGTGTDPADVSSIRQLNVYNDTDSPTHIDTWTFMFPPPAPSRDLLLAGRDVRSTSNFYDGMGRLIQVREALGSFNAPSDSTAHILRNLPGYRVSQAYIYDGFGQLWAALDPFYDHTPAYTDLVAPSRNTQPATHAHVNLFDQRGRVTCALHQNLTMPLKYAPTTCETVDDGNNYKMATLFQYSTDVIQGRTLTKMQRTRFQANGTPFEFSSEYFDASGRLRVAKDATGNIDRVTYDELGRITSRNRSVSGETIPRWFQNYAYDSLGRLLQDEDADSGTRVYTYDDSGLLKTASQISGQFPKGEKGALYTYGSLGRLTQVDHFLMHKKQNGEWEKQSYTASTYHYDRPALNTVEGQYRFTVGRLAESKTPGFLNIAYGYNADGLLTREDRELLDGGEKFVSSARIKMSHDNRPLETSLLVRIGDQLQKLGYQTHYDSYGRPVSLSNEEYRFWLLPPGNDFTSSSYNAYGRAEVVLLNEGKAGEFQRFNDKDTHLSSFETQIFPSAGGGFGPRTVLFLKEIKYVADKLISYTDTSLNTKYEYYYDCHGRLRQALATPIDAQSPTQGQVFNEWYSFNLTKGNESCPLTTASLGNIEAVFAQQQSGEKLEQTYQYPAQQTNTNTKPDALLRMETKQGAGIIQVEDYAYDSWGSLVSRKNGDDTEQYVYDAENRLVKISRTSEPGEVLKYDSSGELAYRQLKPAQNSEPSKKIYYLGPYVTIFIQDGGPTQINLHVLLGGKRIASVRSNDALYYHRDHLDSIIATSLATPATVGRAVQVGARYRYDAYGAVNIVRDESSQTASDLGYTGALKLTNGLFHLKTRVYDPRIRRFLQPDVIDTLRYTYVGGDPINRIDPNGRKPLSDWNEDVIRRVSDMCSGGIPCLGFGPGGCNDNCITPGRHAYSTPGAYTLWEAGFPIEVASELANRMLAEPYNAGDIYKTYVASVEGGYRGASSSRRGPLLASNFFEKATSEIAGGATGAIIAYVGCAVAEPCGLYVALGVFGAGIVDAAVETYYDASTLNPPAAQVQSGPQVWDPYQQSFIPSTIWDPVNQKFVVGTMRYDPLTGRNVLVPR